jgi:hypothetical protein
LSTDQQAVEEGGVPSQVLLVDLVRHGQHPVKRSSPGKQYNKFSSTVSENTQENKVETKKNAYHDSITNSELNVISAREIEKLLNQSKKIL